MKTFEDKLIASKIYHRRRAEDITSDIIKLKHLLGSNIPDVPRKEQLQNNIDEYVQYRIEIPKRYGIDGIDKKGTNTVIDGIDRQVRQWKEELEISNANLVKKHNALLKNELAFDQEIDAIKFIDLCIKEEEEKRLQKKWEASGYAKKKEDD